MGILRVLLALSVVLFHAGAMAGFQPLGSVEAVETFFIISGFYMAMILTEKYDGPGSLRLFYYNRFLRIYPLYWVVAAASLIFWLAPYITHKGHGALYLFGLLQAPGRLLVAFSNLFLFGQDVVMFTGADAHGHLYFTPNFRLPPIHVWQLLLIPPAWSLAVELTFYLVAPWIVRRSFWLITAVIVASLALRAYLFFALGLRQDPWTYRFFPTEIGFFLAGSLAYRVYAWLRMQDVRRPVFLLLPVPLFLAFFVYQFLPALTFHGAVLNAWRFYLLAWAGIPGLFLLSANSRFDRYIGELSYPIYIVHWHVVTFVQEVWAKMKFTRGTQLVIIVLTLLGALVLIHFVSKPIERIRRMRARRLVSAVRFDAAHPKTA